MSYTVSETGQVRRDRDGAWIPSDPSNQDYMEFLVWCETNKPQPAEKEKLPVKVKRKMHYPAVHEQLEALYDARQGDRTKLDEIDAKIKQVKERFPKK